MARKKTPELNYIERVRILHKAGLNTGHQMCIKRQVEDEIADIDDRIKYLMNFTSQSQKNSDMIFFIMYDIENNKIRTEISKYLIRSGCYRVQKSIFMAQKNREQYNEICKTLKEVQECYDNSDSIFIVPISTDEIKAMKVLGQNIDFDLIIGNKNTLFF
ncbi:MAG: CRISPR-associated endonuclease Cas2 [Bacteroidales bacterium]|nr:CRISPR-associated endonuclease Cas2 [Bacteroidales bacterium]MDD2387481.1 CRISPR-associated endonuclease Cas2 [Bacteroidales bacterium]MDD4218420.1 CRISPR-associated endonuclease Cas2 [Bacteroidales bacterium]MDY0143355.1 CRISPR-associated endonuclease Cas2 [Bacteroidales bacterium]